MTTTAKRIEGIQEYYFSEKLREIEALNKKGLDIINLGIGNPDLAPPQAAIEKLISSAKVEKNHGYQSYKGIGPLRVGFAEFYKNFYDVDLDPEAQILPLIGSKEGITYISQTFIEEGDEVLIPDPGYPAYAAATRMAGGKIKFYNLKEDQGWLPDLKKIALADLSRVKLMWINYPHMPTGAKASVSIFKEIVAFAIENNILLCNDNPYSFILNDNPLSIFSATGVTSNVLELNSLSKSHNMAGWRIGMVAGAREHINSILISKSNVDSGMFLPVQEAAVEALKQEKGWFKEQNNIYSERRKIVWEIMEQLNCSYNCNASGLFVWGKAPEEIKDVAEWLDEILQKGRVFLTPGFIFGKNGKRFIRISLCTDKERLKEALQRIKTINR
ncbi:MAG: pyridoxal phosphate-dependent aminotransferase [Candidatus Cyclobacteriaceae bacterium M2_1C_046]